jgi:hypothetical protein
LRKLLLLKKLLRKLLLLKLPVKNLLLKHKIRLFSPELTWKRVSVLS